MEYVSHFPEYIKSPHLRLIEDIRNIGDLADEVAFLISGELAVNQWFEIRGRGEVSSTLTAYLTEEKKMLQQFLDANVPDLLEREILLNEAERRVKSTLKYTHKNAFILLVNELTFEKYLKQKEIKKIIESTEKKYIQIFR